MKVYPKSPESSRAHQLLERYKIATGGESPFIHRQTLASAMRFSTVELSELEQKIATLRTQVEDLESAKADAEARYSQQLTEKDDEFTQLTYQYERDKVLWTQKVAQLENTITAFKLERVPEKDLSKAPPQGAVRLVANRTTAYIDLGRRDFVRPGLVFEIYKKEGAVRVKKGMLEINRVEDTWSQVTILEEVSELDPIVTGDMIWSPFYKKGHKPTVSFVGDKLSTQLLSLDLLKRKLADAGVI